MCWLAMRSASDSGSLFQFDNGQFSPVFQMRDDKAQFHAIGAAHFEAWIRRLDVQTDFLRDSTGEGLMGAEVIVPTSIGREMFAHQFYVKRNEDLPGPLVLERTHKSLDDGYISVFADGSVTQLDLPALAPCSESVTVELRAFVRDEVLRCPTGLANHAREERPDINGRRLFAEDGKPHDGSGEMKDGVVVQGVSAGGMRHDLGRFSRNTSTDAATE